MEDAFDAVIDITLVLGGVSVTTLGSCVVFGVVIDVVLTTHGCSAGFCCSVLVLCTGAVVFIVEWDDVVPRRFERF